MKKLVEWFKGLSKVMKIVVGGVVVAILIIATVSGMADDKREAEKQAKQEQQAEKKAKQKATSKAVLVHNDVLRTENYLFEINNTFINAEAILKHYQDGDSGYTYADVYDNVPTMADTAESYYNKIMSIDAFKRSEYSTKEVNAFKTSIKDWYAFRYMRLLALTSYAEDTTEIFPAFEKDNKDSAKTLTDTQAILDSSAKTLGVDYKVLQPENNAIAEKEANK
ncbi:hypothetical protein K5A21_002868 [Listeria innocua]|uniref:hypothetical protein n=1 Tax=Listeria TaxID=1637 RepID=UPI000F228FD1|nr:MULTISPECIES: hypothetical protein [Listeria]MBM5606667.1 hypothetical protein [Listeria seeligeri]EAC7992080.1 hypothetical protein [Listeria monocytogenes]EAC8007152.1 hypothetical protein [Listeria monocytogenes]EAD6723873.1 hypothetical protein [Listeria monocytogenes]EAE0719580.1 hypothetical protein [Listeria monocytogenes]